MTCHLCGEDLDRAHVVGTTSRYERESRRVCCRRCGLVQVCPQPTEEELLAYYRDGYRRDYLADTHITITDGNGRRTASPDQPEEYERALTRKAELEVESVSRLGLPAGASVLEVGCGEGRTLRELMRAGYEPAGMDPDGTAVEKARGLAADCDVYEAHWSEVRGGRLDNFDAVVCFHVLEHVVDPLGFLMWCRGRLQPGGKVLCEVPNVDKPNGPLQENHWQWVHLYDFSPHTLGALAQRAGLAEVRTVPHGGAVTLIASSPKPYYGEPLAYEPHTGPSGDAQALWLKSYEQRNAPVQAPNYELVERFLSGENVEDLDGLRREWLAERREVSDLSKQWGDVKRAIWEFADQAEGLGYAAFDVWTHDDQVNGQVWGEGHAWTRTGILLKKIHEAMVRAEVTYRGRCGGG